MSDLLQISHLGKSYDGKNFALKDVSASLRQANSSLSSGQAVPVRVPLFAVSTI